MCVLRDTYLVDDPAYREICEEDTKMQSQGTQKVKIEEEDKVQAEHHPDKTHLQLISETVEETSVVTEVKVELTRSSVTAYYWCRVCKQKTPASQAKSCDCGVTMCNSCWEEWEVTCPICDSDLS